MVSVQVEIGPVPRGSAEAWFDYADAVIHDLRQIGADRAPPEVLDTFENLVEIWRSELPRDPEDGGQPESFHWVDRAFR